MLQKKNDGSIAIGMLLLFVVDWQEEYYDWIDSVIYSIRVEDCFYYYYFVVLFEYVVAVAPASCSNFDTTLES
jgi:hypothetical protein